MTDRPINEAFIEGRGEPDPRGPWMQTYTGKQLFPLRVDQDHIDILDIAHALSLICRFNGHCREFYSVAEHSVRVCDVLPAELRLQGLLHDAAEAYLGDSVCQLKAITKINGCPYKTWEQEIMLAVATTFGVVYPFDPLVKEADMVLLATEKRDLMREEADRWIDLPPPLAGKIYPSPPSIAEDYFLRCFERIQHVQTSGLR